MCVCMCVCVHSDNNNQKNNAHTYMPSSFLEIMTRLVGWVFQEPRVFVGGQETVSREVQKADDPALLLPWCCWQLHVAWQQHGNSQPGKMSLTFKEKVAQLRLAVRFDCLGDAIIDSQVTWKVDVHSVIMCIIVCHVPKTWVTLWSFPPKNGWPSAKS